MSKRKNISKDIRKTSKKRNFKQAFGKLKKEFGKKHKNKR